MYTQHRSDSTTFMLAAALLVAVAAFWAAFLGMDHSAPGPAGLPVVVTQRTIVAAPPAASRSAVTQQPAASPAAAPAVQAPAAARIAPDAAPAAASAAPAAPAAEAAGQAGDEREVVTAPVREQTQRPQPSLGSQAVVPLLTAPHAQGDTWSGKNSSESDGRSQASVDAAGKGGREEGR